MLLPVFYLRKLFRVVALALSGSWYGDSLLQRSYWLQPRGSGGWGRLQPSQQERGGNSEVCVCVSLSGVMCVCVSFRRHDACSPLMQGGVMF